HRAIDQITCNDDQIRFQSLCFINNGLYPGALQQTTGVQISQLHQLETIQLGGQALDLYFDGLELGDLHCLPDTQCGQADRCDAQHAPQGRGAQQKQPGWLVQNAHQQTCQIGDQGKAGSQQDGPESPAQDHDDLCGNFR